MLRDDLIGKSVRESHFIWKMLLFQYNSFITAFYTYVYVLKYIYDDMCIKSTAIIVNATNTINERASFIIF